MGIGAAVAGGLGLVGNLIAGDKASKEMARARAEAGDQQAQAMLQMREAVERLESEGVPSVEAQQIVLQSPELVGLQDVHEIATSGLEDIEVDPRLREAQMGALEDVQQLTETGQTAGERAQEQLDTRQIAAQEQARRKAILQGMAERGVSGGGQELAALLQGSQSAAERKATMQAQRIQDREARRLAAIQQAAQLGGQIRGQEFDEQAQVASAADAIKKFNIANRMNVEAANLTRRQQIANEAARIANIQEQYNKGLIGQQYGQRMQKAQAIAAAQTGQAQQLQQQAGQTMQQGQAAASGQLQQGAAIGSLAGNIAGTVAQMGGESEKPIPAGQQPASYSPFESAEDGGIIKNEEYADGGVTPMALPPKQPMQMQQEQSLSPSGFEDGGMQEYAGGDIALITDDEEIIPGDDFAGDRVDAKINSGEMVLNVEQQQRLMDLLKGYRNLAGLGEENIVEKPPISNPDVELPEDLPSMPPPSIAEAEQMGPLPEGLPDETPIPEMKDGGMIQDDLGHRLLKEHKKMSNSENELKEAQKQTRAKIKALETLMGKK